MAKTVVMGGRLITITMCPPRAAALPWHLTDVSEQPIDGKPFGSGEAYGRLPR